MATPSDHQCVDAEVKAKTPYLPPEIKHLVAEHLNKSVLKILRYVSREWNLIATPFLFDRVYISSYEMDFQVFNHITQTPSLANSVREVICDLSAVEFMDYNSYLISLRAEIKTIARPDQSRAFHSSDRRFNRFVNDFTQDDLNLGKLKSQYAQRLAKSYRLWRQLDDQVRSTTQAPSFDDALCAGFRRLPRLEAVKMDNGIWERHRRTTSIASTHGIPPSQMQPYDILGVAESGSPLSRSWNPWQLRPVRSDYSGTDWLPWPLAVMLQALVKTETRLKRFDYWEPDYHCMTVDFFRYRQISDDYPMLMVAAFEGLEHLDLQITPHEIEFERLNPTRPLGFLPQFLESMFKLKSLSLRLESHERVIVRHSGEEGVLYEECLTYSQVFSPNACFPDLEYFHLGGMAVDGVDLSMLLHTLMPRSKRLSLGRIDLMGHSWDTVVEIMRQVGDWEMCCLEGPFRHKDHEWWPPTESDKEEGDRSALGSYMRYICEGGRHPTLSKELPDIIKRDLEAITSKVRSLRQSL
ncbi:MAG: hypothetical protein Q9194_007098 [Teloschistes cf. exilis]